MGDQWEERWSKSKNHVYYYNASTGESVWEKPSGFSTPKAENQVKVSHILVKHKDSRRPSSWKEENITRSKEEAIKILNGIRNDVANALDTFANVAQVQSDCSSAKKGGDLGFFKAGAMQPEFESASFALQVGELSPIVETASGVHIILRTA